MVENNRFVLLCVGQNHYIFNVVLSFDELWKCLFTIHDETAFLSNRLGQDPVEEDFGMQRLRGGVHDNPNVTEF